MILAEEVLLIALDDEKGTDGASWGSDTVLGGALLLDLVRGGHVAEDGKTLVARPDVPAHPTLRAAHEVIAADDKQRKPSDWVSRLGSKLKPIVQQVAEPLVQAGVLDEQRHKTLGIFKSTRYPTADPGPERELREQLHAVLVAGREPTEEEAALLGLLQAADLVGQAVPKEDRKAAKARAKAVAERTTASDAVKSTLDGVQAAVLIATTTAATTAATTTTS